MFVKFTDPDGHDIWIVPRWVTRVRPPIQGRHDSRTNALIIMGNSEQAVREEVKTVLKRLEGTPLDDDDAAVRRA
jgi:hypothetical protein